jgi:hypothetical protein
MPMLGPKMSLAMQGALASKGNAGVNLALFCNAVGNGSVASVVGKTFTTTDTGTGSGAGVGTGVGIMGVAAGSISKAIQAAYLMEFGMIGTLTPTICDAIGQGLEAELKLATLTSSHSPCAVGSGVVDVGSIKVSGSEWGGKIIQMAPTFVGQDWPRFANVIGKGCAQAFAPATGQVTIAGSPAGTPSPYSGPNSVVPAGVIT